MGILRNLSSPSTSLTAARRRQQQKLNGNEWFMFQRAYNPSLIKYYQLRHFADRGIRFLDFLKTDEAKLQIEYLGGPYRPLEIELTAYNKEDSGAQKPWLIPKTKLRLANIQGSDAHLVARLEDSIARAMADGRDPRTLHVTIVDRKTSRSPAATQNNQYMFGYLINTRPYQLEAIVSYGISLRQEVPPLVPPRARARPSSSAVTALSNQETDIGSRFSGAGGVSRKQHVRRPIPSHNLMPIEAAVTATAAKQPALPPSKSALAINEQISDNLSKLIQQRMQAAGANRSDSAMKRQASKLMKDQQLVAQAVQETMLDDKLYDKPELGAKQQGAGARAYWKDRGVKNMAHLCNSMTHEISAQIGTIDPKKLLKKSAAVTIESELGGAPRRSVDALVAQQTFAAAAIQCGIWESIKRVTGYDGPADDGGYDQGPSVSLILHKHRFGHVVYREQDLTPDVALHHRMVQHEERMLATPVIRVRLAEPEKYGDCVAFVHRNSYPLEQEAAVAEVTTAASDGEGSTDEQVFSGGEEDDGNPLWNRAQLRKHGYPSRHPDSLSGSESSSDDDSSADEGGSTVLQQLAAATSSASTSSAAKLDEKNHSNFLQLLRLAYPTDTAFMNVGLVLALPNAVFTNQHLEKVVMAVKRGARRYVDFIDNYIIPGPFGGLNGKRHSARSGVIYTVNESGLLCPREDCLKHIHGARISLKVEAPGYVCGGFPTTVRFASIPLNHNNF